MPKSDTNREPRPKKKKNESLELLRAITKSMAGAIPGVSAETSETLEDSLARPLSGFASQVLGEDPNEPGKLVFPPLHNLKRVWNADARRKAGLEPEKMAMPGMVQDSLSLPAIFGGGPQWAQDASASADRIHAAVDEGMDLAPPQGFRQHALNSAGMMAAQIPVAGKAKEVPEIAEGALQIMKKYGKKALASPFEFFLPTIDPKMSNYLFGSVAGGGLGTLGDEAGEIAEELPPPRAVARAEGGKVGALKAFLKTISMNPDARVRQTAHQMGDPVEEVLYATNEGQRRGVLSSEEAKRIKILMNAGEEEALSEALIELHRRLNPEAAKDPKLQKLPPWSDLVFQDKGYREPVHGTGTLPGVEPEVPLLKKGTGGKIQGAARLLQMLKNLDLDPHEFDLIDERGNLRVDEAKEVIEDAMHGEREVEDFVDDLDADSPEGITQAIQSRALKDPEDTSELDQMLELIEQQIGKGSEILDVPKMLNNSKNKLVQQGTVKVLKNPTQEEVLRFTGREIPRIRMMTLRNGDTYVWDGDAAIHDWVLRGLGLDREELWQEMSDTPIRPSDYQRWLYSDPTE